MPNTPLGPGTSYPWDPADSTYVPPQTPEDKAAADAAAKKKAAADKAAADAKALQPRALSEFEQQAIVKAIGGREGWTVVGGAAVPKTQLSQNSITGEPQLVPTGTYTVTLADPQGRNHDDIQVTPGAVDENGVTAWVPSSVAANAPTPAHPDIPSQNGQPAMTWDPAQNRYVPLPGAPTQGQLPPTEGKTRPAVENGRNVTQTYQGGNWTTTSVGDPAVPGAAVEGNTRNNVQGGRNVLETYQNGEWKVTQVGSNANPDAPQKNETRPAVENGRNVTQTFDGTTWRTTGVGDVATPGAPTEGLTRKNVQGGYTIQEVYKNGAWIPDTSVPPVRFTPQDPTVVSAPNTQGSIVTMQNGQINTQTNPNFMPTTTAEVAARVAQLRSQAQAQRDALEAKQQAGQITGDQAKQQFDQWYAQNIEPQKPVLDAAQRAARQAEDIKAQEQQRSNVATAQTGAGAILTAAMANRPNSPAYAAALGSVLGATRGAPKVDYTAALSAPGPDVQDIYTKATAAMLQHISPTAAQIATGQPVPTALAAAQNTDINQALSPTQYAFGGAPPAGAAAAQGGNPGNVGIQFNQAANPANVSGRTMGPGGVILGPNGQPIGSGGAPLETSAQPFDWAALQARMEADRQEQARQAQAMASYTPGVYQPAF